MPNQFILTAAQKFALLEAKVQRAKQYAFDNIFKQRLKKFPALPGKKETEMYFIEYICITM